MFVKTKNLPLGKSPKHISKDLLLDYFIYTFEPTWFFRTFDNFRGQIEVHFKSQLNDLKTNQELTFEQEWWVLILFALKDLVEGENLSYATETIQFLINRIHTLSNEDLEEYANSINSSLFEQMPTILTIRPSEISNLESDAKNDDVAFNHLIEKKQIIIEILKEHVKINNIAESFTKRSYEKQINKYEIWNVIFEYYLECILYMHLTLGEDYIEDERELENLLYLSHVSFLTEVIIDSSNIDTLCKALSNVVNPIFSVMNE